MEVATNSKSNTVDIPIEPLEAEGEARPCANGINQDDSYSWFAVRTVEHCNVPMCGHT